MLAQSIDVVVICGYTWQHLGPHFQFGALVALIAYVHQFTASFLDIGWQWTEIITAHTDVLTADLIAEAYASQHRPEVPPLDSWQKMEIQNLSYSHGSTPVLQDINMCFRRGQRIALIGESGCGKSTLLAIFRGLYSGQASLKVDNRETDFASLTTTVTLCPQEPEIFESTIRHNLTLGLNVDENEIRRACELSRFASVLARLPHGLDTHIKEKGVNLSGGERQRLALSRGLLAAHSSSILLMDEPTSSVDPATESDMYDRLFAEFSDKTIISSLHRLHLLPRFDYIYVLESGRIIRHGTWENIKHTIKSH